MGGRCRAVRTCAGARSGDGEHALLQPRCGAADAAQAHAAAKRISAHVAVKPDLSPPTSTWRAAPGTGPAGPPSVPSHRSSRTIQSTSWRTKPWRSAPRAGQVDAALANCSLRANCPEALALCRSGVEVLQHRGDYASLDRYLDGLRQERFCAGNESSCAMKWTAAVSAAFLDIEPSVIFRFAPTYDVTPAVSTATPVTRCRRGGPGVSRVGYLSQICAIM